MLPLAPDDQGDRWLNAQPSAQPMLGPRGLLPKASCRAPSDRGPDQPLPPALTPHPPRSLSYLRLGGGAAFLVLSDHLLLMPFLLYCLQKKKKKKCLLTNRYIWQQ